MSPDLGRLIGRVRVLEACDLIFLAVSHDMVRIGFGLLGDVGALLELVDVRRVMGSGGRHDGSFIRNGCQSRATCAVMCSQQPSTRRAGRGRAKRCQHEVVFARGEGEEGGRGWKREGEKKGLMRERRGEAGLRMRMRNLYGD